MNHNVLDTYDLSDCQFEDGQRCFGGLESDSETLVLIVGSKAVPAMLMPYTISITEQMKSANLRPGLIHLCTNDFDITRVAQVCTQAILSVP